MTVTLKEVKKMLIAMYFIIRHYLPTLLAMMSELITGVGTLLIVLAGITILFASVGITTTRHTHANVWSFLTVVFNGVFALCRLLFIGGVNIARAVFNAMHGAGHPVWGVILAILAVLLYI